jgi:hypothetical protein
VQDHPLLSIPLFSPTPSFLPSCFFIPNHSEQNQTRCCGQAHTRHVMGMLPIPAYSLASELATC